LSTTIIFVGVVVAAFIGGRVLSTYAWRLTLLSGVEYLLLGVLIGPQVLDVLSAEVLQALDVFVSFVLGVMGFVVGLGVRRVRGGLEVGLAGASTTLWVSLAVGGLAVAAVQFLDPRLLAVEDPVFSRALASDGHQLLRVWVSREALWFGLTVGAAAGVCSFSMIELAGKQQISRWPGLGVLRSIGASSQFAAVLLLGVAMAGSRAAVSAEALGMTLTEWSVLTVAAGAACGVLFTLFLGNESDPMRMLVAAVGAITFAAGIGSALGVSPLFVNLIAGALVGATSPHADKLDEALEALNLPTRVLVLLVAGAFWSPVSGLAWLLPVAYAVVRAAALRYSAPLNARTFIPQSDVARGLGSALLGQGALAAAIAISFAQRFPQLSGLVTTTILGGMLLTDLVSVPVLRRYLADRGALKLHEAHDDDDESVTGPDGEGAGLDDEPKPESEPDDESGSGSGSGFGSKDEPEQVASTGSSELEKVLEAEPPQPASDDASEEKPR